MFYFQVIQNLNESVYEYINENSIEKNFNQYTDQLIDKLNAYSNDLESKLNSKLKLKYSKYNTYVSANNVS